MTLYRNLAGQEIFFTLVDAVTGEAVTGASVTVWITQDSGVQAAGGGTVDDLGHGQYRYNFSAADTDGETVGLLLLATGCVPMSFAWTTEAIPPEPIPGTGGPLLVSLEVAKRHLRLPVTEGSPSAADSDLLQKIAVSSDLVRAFITPSGSPPESDSWDETTAPPIIQHAVLLQTAMLWAHRGDELVDLQDGGGIGSEAAMILRASGYRDPTLA